MGPEVELTRRHGVRERVARDQGGQLLVMWLVFMLPLVVLCFGVFNVGVMVSEKMKVQNAADAAAYSAATWNARYLNQTAYLNRTIVANYDTIAALTGIWSFIDGLDGFVGLIRTLLRVFFNIGEAITPAALALHQANDVYSNVLGGGQKNKRLGAYLEGYNQVLSYAQQALYIANQFGRGRVSQTVAWGVDPKIEYGFASEVWGLQEMGNRRDWKKSDKEKGLRLTLERSLNELSNGGSFRDLDNFPIIGTLVDIVNLIPCFEITVGPEGFDGPGFNHVSGQPGGAGKVKIANDEKIYQNDFAGLKIEFDCIVSFTLIAFGHNSDDAKNLPNNFASGFPGADLSFPHVVDEEGDHGGDTFQAKGGKGFIKRNVDCDSAVGPSAGSLNLGAGQDPQFAKTQEAQKLCGTGDDPFRAVDVDGNNDGLAAGPVKGAGILGGEPFLIDSEKAEQNRVAENQARANENPPRSPVPASALGDDRSCWQIQQELKAKQEALKKDLAKGFKSGGTCATIFELATPLSEREVTQYVQREATPDGKRLEGPSVFVYLRKPAELLPMFKGLGLLNRTNVEAYAFGRAYYTQRPGGSGEKETTFNPFWAGRLEKAPIFSH